jgi:uncharacterized protein with GYD domain
MATYVHLLKWTDQGIRNYKDTVSRADKYAGLVKESGGRLIQQLWTNGEYDVVLVLDAPDDETAAQLSLQLGALGNVRGQTLRAFTPEEMRNIIAKSKP